MIIKRECDYEQIQKCSAETPSTPLDLLHCDLIVFKASKMLKGVIVIEVS